MMENIYFWHSSIFHKMQGAKAIFYVHKIFITTERRSAAVWLVVCVLIYLLINYTHRPSIELHIKSPKIVDVDPLLIPSGMEAWRPMFETRRSASFCSTVQFSFKFSTLFRFGQLHYSMKSNKSLTAKNSGALDIGYWASISVNIAFWGQYHITF